MAIKFNLAFCRRIAVFAGLLHLVSALDNCPSGWDGYGNSCYKFVIQSSSMRGLSWENARRDCLGSGGDLVSIENQTEMSFIYNKSSMVWNEHYWIGLSDRRNESQFVWSDGTPYNDSGYSNWRPGEPNNRAGEDCVELFRTHWNDNNCKEEFGYICEKPKDCPSGWDGYGNSCYMFVIQSSSMRGLNWDNARRDCLGYEGDLVSIENQSEMSFVYSKSSKVWNQHYWIGLNDRRIEHQFVWSDGTPYNASVYSNWYPGEPNDQDGEDCVELYRTRWNDENCRKEYGYICERPKGSPMIDVTTVIPPVTPVPPRIMKDVCPTSVTCKRYTVCSLCCHTTSDSPVKYTWTKDGKKPKNGEIKVINDYIVITPRSAKDYGVYECNALNSYGNTSYEITLTEDMSQEDDSLSNIYRIIVIALSCIVFVLLIAVGLLTWRLTRAVTKKREKTPEVGTSYKGMQHETPLDQHASLGDGYLEPLEVMSSATSHYQSIHRNRTSAKCGNVVSNSGTDNGEEDELYVSIIP